jgi:hypothetical protein
MRVLLSTYGSRGAVEPRAAARAAAPQAVVPQIVDRPYWAGRVTVGRAENGPGAKAVAAKPLSDVADRDRRPVSA